MDPLSMVMGLVASLLVQIVKRKGGGSLENILGSLGVAVGGATGLGNLGMALDPVQVAFASFASHGLLSGTEPYKVLKMGAIDALFDRLGKAVGSVASSPPPG